MHRLNLGILTLCAAKDVNDRPRGFVGRSGQCLATFERKMVIATTERVIATDFNDRMHVTAIFGHSFASGIVQHGIYELVAVSIATGPDISGGWVFNSMPKTRITLAVDIL